VHRRIIEYAFARKELTLTGDEVYAAVEADIKAVNVTRDQFERDVLPKYGKTMDEWVEDVITPRVMLAKLCKTRVAAPTEAELRASFDAKYGEKRECRMIHCATAEEADRVYKEVSAGAEAFDRAARRQKIPALAAAGGRFDPVPTSPSPLADASDADLHGAVTALRPGQVSQPLAITSGVFLVIRCEKVIPPDKSKSFDAEKPMLLKEVLEARINREVPTLFAELRREAKPQYHLTFPDPGGPPKPVPAPKK
jgi:hypothetical protein